MKTTFSFGLPHNTTSKQNLRKEDDPRTFSCITTLPRYRYYHHHILTSAAAVPTAATNSWGEARVRCFLWWLVQNFTTTMVGRRGLTCLGPLNKTLTDIGLSSQQYQHCKARHSHSELKKRVTFQSGRHEYGSCIGIQYKCPGPKVGVRHGRSITKRRRDGVKKRIKGVPFHKTNRIFPRYTFLFFFFLFLQANPISSQSRQLEQMRHRQDSQPMLASGRGWRGRGESAGEDDEEEGSV